MHQGIYHPEDKIDKRGLQVVEQSILKLIKRFVEALAKENIRTNKVILYGSYATGKHTEYSGIDIAVVSEDFGKDRIEEKIRGFH
ncbi:MAG: nucleotidyltransferase domain-containing protein [bacterium]